MKKYIRISILLLAVLIIFCSCNNEKKTCEELLATGLEYGIDGYCDSGYIFLKNADTSSVFFLTEKQKNIMYSRSFLDVFERLKDFAIYISASTPYELSVFECYSKNDASYVLRMCYERADELKIALRFGKWEDASKGITVLAYKKYVIFAFTESLERSEDTVNAVISVIG